MKISECTACSSVSVLHLQCTVGRQPLTSITAYFLRRVLFFLIRSMLQVSSVARSKQAFIATLGKTDDLSRPLNFVSQLSLQLPAFLLTSSRLSRLHVATYYPQPSNFKTATFLKSGRDNGHLALLQVSPKCI
jgi:hypothetical protein